MSRKKLIVILGPTSSGKSELALELAKKFNGYIISADSRQIYKYMDIGTAKPCQAQSAKRKAQNYINIEDIPHYLIDVINPDQEFTVADYQKQVYSILDSRFLPAGRQGKIQDSKLPFLIGGTGLYISSIIDGLKIPHVPPDKILRKRLNKFSVQKLFLKLKKFDPKLAETIDKKNKRRLIRALEVCMKTGKPMSAQIKKELPSFDILEIGIKLSKKELYNRIDKRVDQMIKKGLIEEVKKLHQRGYSWNLPSLSGLGYKEIGLYLQGKISLDEATKLIKLHTRQYAKRQMTWFKRDRRIKWVENKKETEKLIKEFLKLME